MLLLSTLWLRLEINPVPPHCSTLSSSLDQALAAVNACEGTIVFDASTTSKSYTLTAAYILGLNTARKAICITVLNKSSAKFLVGRHGAYNLYSCACVARPLLSSRVGRQCHRHSRRCDLDGTHGKSPFSVDRCQLYTQSNRHQLCGRATGGGSKAWA